MGLGRLMSNKKRTTLETKAWRKHRIRKAEAVRRQGGPKQAEVANPELVTKHILKKRRTSPRTNVTLSGKKKRKLMKQLKHMQAEKSRMEVEEEPKKKKNTTKSAKGDVEMKDGENEASTSQPSSTEDVDMAE